MTRHYLCAILCLSPCDLSAWMVGRKIKAEKEEAIAAALSAWVDDPDFSVPRPSIMFANSRMVPPKSVLAAPPKRIRSVPTGSSPGGGGSRDAGPGCSSGSTHNVGGLDDSEGVLDEQPAKRQRDIPRLEPPGGAGVGGDACASVERRVCESFLLEGACLRGGSCPFRHAAGGLPDPPHDVFQASPAYKSRARRSATTLVTVREDAARQTTCGAAVTGAHGAATSASPLSSGAGSGGAGRSTAGDSCSAGLHRADGAAGRAAESDPLAGKQALGRLAGKEARARGVLVSHLEGLLLDPGASLLEFGFTGRSGGVEAAAEDGASSTAAGHQSGSGWEILPDLWRSAAAATRPPTPPSLAAMIKRARAGGYVRVSDAMNDLLWLVAAAAEAIIRHQPAALPSAPCGGPGGRCGVSCDDSAEPLKWLLQRGLAKLRSVQADYGDVVEGWAGDGFADAHAGLDAGAVGLPDGPSEPAHSSVASLGGSSPAPLFDILGGPFGGQRATLVWHAEGRVHVQLDNLQIVPVPRYRLRPVRPVRGPSTAGGGPSRAQGLDDAEHAARGGDGGSSTAGRRVNAVGHGSLRLAETAQMAELRSVPSSVERVWLVSQRPQTAPPIALRGPETGVASAQLIGSAIDPGGEADHSRGGGQTAPGDSLAEVAPTDPRSSLKEPWSLPGCAPAGCAGLTEGRVSELCRWAAEHFPRFQCAARPCEVLVDGRSPGTFLGTVPALGGGGGESSVPPPGGCVGGLGAEHAGPDVGGCNLSSSAQHFNAGSCCPADASLSAVVVGYGCSWPVLVHAKRCEVAALSARPVSAGRTSWRVLWADGEESVESTARLGLDGSGSAYEMPAAEGTMPAAKAPVAVEPAIDPSIVGARCNEGEPSPCSAVGAYFVRGPPDWELLVASLSGELRASLLRDAAAWGLGPGRRGACPRWGVAEARLLRRYMRRETAGSARGGQVGPATEASSAEGSVACAPQSEHGPGAWRGTRHGLDEEDTVLAAVAMLLGRALPYVRMRWRQARIEDSIAPALEAAEGARAAGWEREEAGAGGAACPADGDAGGGVRGAVSSSGDASSAADARLSDEGLSIAVTEARPASMGLADATETLGRLTHAISACLWRLSEELGEAFPPDAWRLLALDGRSTYVPVHTRQAIKAIEARARQEAEEHARMAARAARYAAMADHASRHGADKISGGPDRTHEICPCGSGAADARTGGVDGASLLAPTAVPLAGNVVAGGARQDLVDASDWPKLNPGAAHSSGAEHAAGSWLPPPRDPCSYVFRIDDITCERPGVPVRAGQYRVPVSAVNELDDEPLPEIVYLRACVGGDDGTGERVQVEAQPAFLLGCVCEDADCGEIPNGCCQCTAEQLTDMPAGEHCAYAPGGLLQLEPGSYIYECNSACACAPTCRNRVVQRDVSVRLEVFKTRHKGWAVRALEPVRPGGFVCEYVGEIIASEVAERRGVLYDAQGFSTLFDLDAAGADNEFTIDANSMCGVARFLNHSCEPNLRPHSVWVDNLSASLPRIAFFAVRDIEAYEELTFDYKYDQGDTSGRKIECRCGVPTCRKWLR